MKKNIFISHWSQESVIALLFKEWIENIFDNTDVFVSSSEKNIVFGEKWEDTMMKALENANIAIVLVSKKSYNRKWIHIETGFCFARNLSLLIVRLDDLLPELMGRPYDNYQSFPVSDGGFTKIFFKALSELLDQEMSSSIGYNGLQIKLTQEVKRLLSNGK